MEEEGIPHWDKFGVTRDQFVWFIEYMENVQVGKNVIQGEDCEKLLFVLDAIYLVEQENMPAMFAKIRNAIRQQNNLNQ